MKSWIIIIAGLAGSWHYMDISSDSNVQSGFLPFLFLFFIVALVIKIAMQLGPGSGRGGDGGDSGFDDFGDGGGGCD